MVKKIVEFDTIAHYTGTYDDEKENVVEAVKRIVEMDDKFCGEKIVARSIKIREE